MIIYYWSVKQGLRYILYWKKKIQLTYGIIYLNMKVFRNFFENELDRLLAEDNFLGSRDP
jgi:hypothetical protein